MATAEPTLDCAKHPGQPAAERCDHCGAPFCGDCRVEDTAAEEVFCSEPCREIRSRTRSGPALPSESVLLEGFDQPIKTGWRLFARSSVAVCLYTAPLAIVMVTAMSLRRFCVESGQSTLADSATVVAGLAWVFGFVLTQVVVSQKYTGLVQGNPYVWTLRRFVPWALSITIVLAATWLGTLALVLPGIYLLLRLFWADEFALIHRAGPFQALKESWQLTRGNVGSMIRFQFLAGLAAFVVLIAGAGLFVAVSATLVQLLGRPGAHTLVWLKPAVLTLVWLMIFVFYGVGHAFEIVYLYGMRAERARSLVGSTKVLDVT